MKRTVLSCAIALVIALGNAAPIFSQDYVNTPVTVSKEKVKIDGKVFYSHIVLEKQTLFSISKAYEVSADEIYNCNPSLKENGLKKNSIILIPIKENEKKEVLKTTAEPTAVTENTDTKKQATKKQATKEQITKDTKLQERKIEQKSRKKVKTHTVRWFEDLDTIAEKYGISVEDLMLANNLTGRKLTSRQKLVIPTDEDIKELKKAAAENEVEKKAQTESVNTEAETKVEEEPEVKEEEEVNELNLFRKNRTDVTMILPLKADGISSSKHNMDFYSGALIAVQELGDEGININLNVLDITDQSSPLSRDILSGNDVVIGPVSSGNLSNVLDLACGSTQIISPLDPRAEKLAVQNWNMIQVPTPHKVLYRELAEWIRNEKSPADSIIFITEKGARDAETYSMMRAAADTAGLNYRTFSYSILEGRDVLEPLSKLMTDNAMNRFIVASESEAFVNDVVRNLNLLIHNKYNVTLYAPAKIRNFETMEVENLHNTNLHLCMGYDINYNDPKVRNFIMKFRALYNVEPSQFAFQGYDIARYYIRLCHKYGKRWPDTLDRNDEEMLQSAFKFRRIENGGWINEGVRKVVYEKDWTIRRF